MVETDRLLTDYAGVPGIPSSNLGRSANNPKQQIDAPRSRLGEWLKPGVSKASGGVQRLPPVRIWYLLQVASRRCARARNKGLRHDFGWLAEIDYCTRFEPGQAAAMSSRGGGSLTIFLGNSSTAEQRALNPRILRFESGFPIQFICDDGGRREKPQRLSFK